MNGIPMKFDYSKTINEQLPTFNYYKDRYVCYELEIIKLRQENQALKKQLEEYKDKVNWYENFEINKTIDSLRIRHNNQQKEFIEYLENEIYSIEPKGTGINYNCEYDSEEDFINAMKEKSKLNTLKEILSKYKEIIGVLHENSKD